MKERQFTVLIADGVAEDCAALQEALSRDPAARYVVIEAESVFRALELCRERSPDCLILDYGTPDPSGRDALRQLGLEEDAPACAVVVLVGPGEASLAVEAMKRGAHECLEKDRARGAELRRAVSHAIQKAEQRRRGAAREHALIEKCRALEACLAVLRRDGAGRKQGEEAWQVAQNGVGSGSAVVPRPESAYHNQAEVRLRLLSAAIEQSSESVIITTAQLDPPGPQIVYVNPAFTKLTGYAPDDVIGKTPRILQGPKTDRSALRRLRKDCAAGKVFQGELINYRRDRSELQLEWSVAPARNERGEVTHFIATQRDVTERRRIETALRRSEEELRLMFDLSAIGATQVSPEGKYLRVNRKLCQMLGYSEQELLQLTLHEVTHPDDRKRSAAELSSSFADGTREFSIEKRYVRKDGTIIWVLINWTVVHDDSGQQLRTVANIQDITARKKAEEALQESEERRRRIAEATQDVLWEMDLKTNRLWWSERARPLFGYPAEESEIELEDWYGRIHPEDVGQFRNQFNKFLVGADSDWTHEYRFRRHDGSYIYILDRGRKSFDESGRPTRIAGAMTDITELKRAEKALRESEERFRSLIEQASDGIFIATTEGTYTDVNTSGCEMLGYTREELQGMKVQDLIRPEDFPRLEANRESLLKGEANVEEWLLRHKDGHYLPAEVGTKILPDGRWYAIARDITERKLAEEALRKSAEEIHDLYNHAPCGYHSLDKNGVIVQINDTELSWLGYTREEVVGKINFGDIITPESLKTFEYHFPRFKAGGSIQGIEIKLIRKNGSILPVLISATAIKDREGKYLMSRSVIYDITERKQAEAEREELLAHEQAAREAAESANRSKDEFLAMVSHELRSPLNAILGYTAMLRYRGYDAQQVRHAADVIERSGKAQAQLIDDLLDTARIISGKLRLVVGPVDMVAVIEESVQTIQPAADAKGISIRAHLPPKIGQITGDPARLQQVVWNLLSNAVKFTPWGGRVEVLLERVDPHICITISDTGKGISPEFLPSVFDRFRQADASSARRYGGLGLGLALVKYLVELHGGTVEAVSAGEGQGATFKVTLPFRAVSSPLGDGVDLPDEVKSSGELAGVRALVVDDEDDARTLLTSVLTLYGADTVAAGSAAEAYMLITSTPPQKRPNVIVSDIGMPGEDGYSLMRRVRKWERGRGAYIPAVALTAYGRSEDRVRALSAGFQMHVAKPVEPAELAVVILSLIRRPRSGETT